jgi:hypothetical protein
MDMSSRELLALGASLVTSELVVFPVRHHSPGCAWQLQRWLDRNAPSAILVEGPRSFTSIMPLLAHHQARMPLAIYTYAVAEQADGEPERRQSAYYPFCDYSPELVAVRHAHARDIPARFIDLDFGEQCVLEKDRGVEAGSLLDEHHYSRSRHLGALAERLGCRDHEELWEHLFEVGATSRDFGAFVTGVAAYCHLSRLDSTDAAMRAEGTLQREAEMAFHVRQALAERREADGPVLAVMGGFHAVAMPGLVASAIPRPVIDSRGRKEEESALIRYAFDRLDRLNGYAAGMTSPAWHQGWWEALMSAGVNAAGQSGSLRRELSLAFLYDVAGELRERHGVALPMPAIAAAHEQVLRLALLRGRTAPIREDVLDAILGCFVKGDADADGALVRQVAKRCFSGYEMGRVPPGASTPPLVRDFDYRVRRQRLKVDDTEPRRIVLDIYRRPSHRMTSRLLHALALLGVPFAVRTAGPDFVTGIGMDRLQEHWQYTYTAATEAMLVEASMYGVTVPLATANRFSARLDRLEADGARGDARNVASMMAHACVLGLHDHLPRVVAMLRQALAADAAVDSVAATAAALSLLWQSREPLEARDVPSLPGLLASAYERACYLAASHRGGDGGVLVTALVTLRELLIGEIGSQLDDRIYWQAVEALHEHHDDPFVRGACLGLRHVAGGMGDAELTSAIKGHFGNPLLVSGMAVAFLRGLLGTARETAWQQASLLQALDGLVAGWSEDTFIACLPELRLAFASMTPRETDRIAAGVSAMHGGAPLDLRVEHAVDASQVQALLTVSASLRTVLASDGLSHWSTS